MIGGEGFPDLSACTFFFLVFSPSCFSAITHFLEPFAIFVASPVRSLTNPLDIDLDVNYVTVDSTAVAPLDYVAIPVTTVTWSAATNADITYVFFLPGPSVVTP